MTKSLKNRGNRLIDITGKKYGWLTAIEPYGKCCQSGGGSHWRCKCKCGNYHITRSKTLRHGECNSCMDCRMLWRDSAESQGRRNLLIIANTSR